MFLESIARADDRWDWRWLSWALMSSHLHYGMLAGLTDPDRFFRSTHTRYAQRFHLRAGRETLGPIFADRPAIHPLALEQLPRLVAYHHRNPVEAGVVTLPRESTWTSHRVYLRLAPAPAWLDVERALDTLGFRDTAAGRRRFDEFVTEVDLRDCGVNPDGSHVNETCMRRVACDEVSWPRLIAIAREVAHLAQAERLDSMSHHAALTRRLVSIVATRDLGQTYASVATQLGMRTGSVFNLVVRQGRTGDLETLLSDLRRRPVSR